MLLIEFPLKFTQKNLIKCFSLQTDVLRHQQLLNLCGDVDAALLFCVLFSVAVWDKSREHFFLKKRKLKMFLPVIRITKTTTSQLCSFCLDYSSHQNSCTSRQCNKFPVFQQCSDFQNCTFI